MPSVISSQPLVAVGNSGAGFSVTYGEVASGESNAISITNVLHDRIWMRALRRNGVAASRVFKDLGLAPGFHGLVDPNTGREPATLILEDFVSGVIAVGACGLMFGFGEHITLGDPTTLVGVGFKCDNTHLWHTFVHDCPTNIAPVTVRRDTAIAGAPLATDLHRLTIIIDGPTKKITWMVDRVIVDSWVPSAPLDQMTPGGPKTMWAASVPLNGDATIRCNGGGIPQLRMIAR